MEIPKTSNICIMGIKGSGKSTVAAKFIRMMRPYFDQVFIYDPMGCFDGYGDDCITIEECIAVLKRGGSARYVYGTPGEAVLLLEYLRERNRILLVFDEADQIFGPGPYENPEVIKWLNDYGRHAEIGIVMIARRPQRMPRDFTAQALLVFRPAMEPTDKLYIRSRVGYEPEPIEQFAWYANDEYGETVFLPPTWAMS